MSVFRARYKTADGIPHVYLRFFASPSPNQTYAALGNLTLRKSEFEDFKRACSGIPFIEDAETESKEQAS